MKTIRVESLPKVNEVCYEDDERIETVKAIEKVNFDNDEDFRYRYYKIMVNCFDKNTNEKNDDEYFMCIKKEEV